MLDMGIIKIELNLNELNQAVQGFKENRLKALEHFSQELKKTASHYLNQLLNLEMTLFLGRSDQQENKRNGYYERQYGLKGIGSIRIRMPLDRKRLFNSEILPAREQIDPRIKEDAALLHLAGISTRLVGQISERLLGIEVSSGSVSQALEMAYKPALAWLSRPITKKYWALFIDGTNFRIQRRNSSEKEPALVVLGLDERNCFSILSIEPGQKDSADCWRAILQELKNRGLEGSFVKLGIMDGLPGLERVFREEFENSQTARCWVHVLRNAMARVPKRLIEAFKTLAKKVMYAESEASAREQFEALKAAMGNDASQALRVLEKDLESLLIHYRFDPRLWRTLKTTNPIERVNKELKRRTKTMESLGERTLRIVTAFVALRLEYYWQQHPMDNLQLENLKAFQPNSIPNSLESIIDSWVH